MLSDKVYVIFKNCFSDGDITKEKFNKSIKEVILLLNEPLKKSSKNIEKCRIEMERMNNIWNNVSDKLKKEGYDYLKQNGFLNYWIDLIPDLNRVLKKGE